MARRSRIQDHSITRLPLSDGDWIEARNALSGVEKKKMSASAFKSMQQTDQEDRPKIEIDMTMLTVARTKAYLTDWNFVDANDKPLKLNSDTIDALDEETLKEIEDALDKHIAEQEAKKQTPSGEPASSSGSLAAVTSDGPGKNTN